MTRREEPPPEAYERVTNPERFQVLHETMQTLLERLEAEFDVQREQGFGLDEDLERNFTLAVPTARLTPSDPDAAPIAVVFSDFPGLHLRFGRWWKEALPSCGCDACNESGEQLAEQLEQLVEDVVAGRFWESDDNSRHWKEGAIWGPDESRRRSRRKPDTESWASRVQGAWASFRTMGDDPSARRLYTYDPSQEIPALRRLERRKFDDPPPDRRIDWKPWPRRGHRIR